jgi:hypothetical protein
MTNLVVKEPFFLVQLFSRSTVILSVDQKPYFLNFDCEKAMRLLEAKKRKGK